MTGINGVILWLIVAVILMIVEGMTFQLVSIWFVIGTIPAMIASALGASPLTQCVLFLVTSIVVLLVGRPLLKRKVMPRRRATNADRVIGMTGVVLQEINNLNETGRVRANGLEWTARTEECGQTIPLESKVTVLAIDGVKLIVALEEQTC